MKKKNLLLQKVLLLFITMILSICYLYVQNVIIKGRVLDATTRTPLEGASVSIANSTIGISTNSNGEFYITAEKGWKYLYN